MTIRQDAVDIGQYIIVPETYDLDTIMSQIIRTLGIVSSIFSQSMLPAIEFDCQMNTRAVEVQNIWAEAVLSEEFQTEKSFIAQLGPQVSFGIC